MPSSLTAAATLPPIPPKRIVPSFICFFPDAAALSGATAVIPGHRHVLRRTGKLKRRIPETPGNALSGR
ncbi:MAG: hypothetical protein II940_03565, partial [Methanosarcinaceae archaeon]|nr:hypothetical protein [Methanosarcinaceae archaeon]